MFIFVGGSAFSATPLNLVQWCYSVILAALCLPFGIVVRLIPDELFERICLPFSSRQVHAPTDEERQFQFPPLDDIRRELAFLKRLRGGRLNNLKFKIQNSSQNLIPWFGHGSGPGVNSTDNNPAASRPRKPSAFGPAAAMAGIIAGSVAGWVPVQLSDGNGNAESPRHPSTLSSSDPEPGERQEIHSNEKPNDPVITDHPPKRPGDYEKEND